MSNLLNERSFSRNRSAGTPCRGVSALKRNCRQKAYIASLLGLLAVAFFVPMTATAAAPFVGKIAAIEFGLTGQKPSVMRTGKSGLVPAKEGDAVFEGDTVKTGANVKARIVLLDESTITIGAESTLRIKAFAHQQAEGRRNYVLKALKGTIRFLISKVNKVGGVSSPWRDSNIAVETPVAIAGIKGTEFVTAISPDGGVEIAVFEGSVSVRNSSLSVQGAVTLAMNQVTRVQRGMRPENPTALSSERRNTLIRLTSVSQNPGQARRAAPAGKYTKKDAERDIAAGVPVADVLNQAAGAGMTIDEMVTAAVSAGVDPATVAYTAIQEGYTAEAVVTSAIANGAELDNVVAAAITAGGDASAVASGATQAGASPDAVATSLANAGASTAPVYGYTTPTGPGDAATVPAAPASVSGGGGATPSTQPASPSAPQ